MASLLVRGPLNDLGDLLEIARVEGRKLLKVKRVNIKPIVHQFNGDYLVIVEPMGSSCSKTSDVGSGKRIKA